MKAAERLKAVDRNPYPWNMEFIPYPDGSGYEARFIGCGICTLMRETKKEEDKMSKKASDFQKKVMSLGYRGKEIFKPLNTGWIDEHVACVREWIANIFFYTKDGTTIMIDAGYSYDRLAEKMKWIGIEPSSVGHILITHQDTDHVGAVERDSGGLFSEAALYLSDIENRYLKGEVCRKVIFGAYKLPRVCLRRPMKPMNFSRKRALRFILSMMINFSKKAYGAG